MAERKKLSSEDRILWSKVARSARAMPGRMHDMMEFEIEPEALSEPSSENIPGAKTKTKKSAGEQPAALPKQSVKQHHPLEKPIKRKLAKGHLPLEARIDLHGMVQSEAHGLLLHFLSRAHGRGLRHVLVITGKGTSMGSDGALKRAVPIWFALPEFRTLISSHEPAARNHGGDGALYVRLSRPKARSEIE